MSLGDHAPFFEAPVVLQGLFTKRMPHEEEVDFTLLSPLVLYHQLHVCMGRCITKWKERNEQKQQINSELCILLHTDRVAWLQL